MRFRPIVAAPILFAFAMLLRGAGSADDSAKKEEKPMPVLASRPKNIPPIDLAAPSKIETATFAMG